MSQLLVPSGSARERLRRLGQVDLGAMIEIATGNELWSVQRRIADAISKPRAHVGVPSCNASGKTYFSGNLVLAFFDAFLPGTPCSICKGPCGGAKIITTSSKWEHLKDNLWGEIRSAYPKWVQNVGYPGRMPPADLRIEYSPQHFAMGQSSDKAEGFQGYHAAHKLILGDEATSLDEQVSQGITSLLSSGDSRLLLIFNPTTPDTYAAQQCRSPRTEVIRITAYDTPHFTGEHVPEGSNLITPNFLEDLEAAGMGPGSYEWTTRVEAKFWDAADDALIAMKDVERAMEAQPVYGNRALGVDLASYGSAENALAWRDGTTLTKLQIFPSMRMDTFWEGPVRKAVRDSLPSYLIYDADGVGAGVIGYAENVAKEMPPGGQLLPFRGALHTADRFRNARSAWYWQLRRRFEYGQIQLEVRDLKLIAQLTGIRYSITPTGEIRVETKEEMKKRGMESPDRADALMYAFALADDLPLTQIRKPNMAEKAFGVTDRSVEAMWDKDMKSLAGYSGDERRWEINPVLGVPDDY